MHLRTYSKAADAFFFSSPLHKMPMVPLIRFVGIVIVRKDPDILRECGEFPKDTDSDIQPFAIITVTTLNS
jgi:hypothetical protein